MGEDGGGKNWGTQKIFSVNKEVKRIFHGYVATE